MKLSEYIEKFGDKQVDVDKLSEFIIEDKVFEPKENEKYYFVDYVGEVSFYFNDDSLDKQIINCHQVYRTKAEAEFARDKAIFLEFMRKEFLRNSDEIDWEDGNQEKSYLCYNHNANQIGSDSSYGVQDATFYTTNGSWLIDFMYDYKNDIKKYYFEVKE